MYRIRPTKRKRDKNKTEIFLFLFGLHHNLRANQKNINKDEPEKHQQSRNIQNSFTIPTKNGLMRVLQYSIVIC